MSRFSRLQRQIGAGRSKQSSNVAHASLSALNQSPNLTYDDKTSDMLKTLEKHSLDVTKERLKPFLVDLLRSNKPFKRINLQLNRIERQADIENIMKHTQVSHEFKDAILAKFRKSDRYLFEIFKIHNMLYEEVRKLKRSLSQATLQQRTEAPEKVYEIDFMTYSFVDKLETMGIRPHFTSPAYIYILDNAKDMNKILDMVRTVGKGINGGLGVVGLDVETGPRKNHSSFPSILQLAISKDIVIIFQLYRLCFTKSDASPDFNLIPDNLKKFLSSPSVLKVGVNIRGDARQLERHTGLIVNNTLCLQHVANILSLKRCSLQHLSLAYIGMPLEKKQGQYAWDSHKSVFSYRSAVYAANDAISSLLVFRKMLSMPQQEPEYQLVSKDNRQFTQSPNANENPISEDTQFSVNIPRKFTSIPLNLENTKYQAIIERFADAAQKNPVSFVKLERIILYTCAAFARDDPLAKLKTRIIISHMINEGILVRK